MIDESLAFKRSFIHGLDPRTRILVALFLSIGAAVDHSFTVLGGYLVLSVILLFLSALTPREVLKRLKPLLFFLFMIWIFLPLSFDQDVIWQCRLFHISRSGLRLSLEITMKSIAITAIFTALIATMTMAAIGHGLQRLRVSGKLVFLLLMTYRYVFVIRDEYTRLLRAARFRGFVAGTNLHSYRTFAYLAGMLFVRASCRAQRVHRAMICRGFAGRFHSLDVYRCGKIDAVFILAGALSALLLFLAGNIRGGA